jgi:Fe2+ transport system protein FeoA
MNVLTPLSKISESVCVFVYEIHATQKLQIKLLAMGLGIGCSLEVIRNRSGDMVIAQGNCRISLGRNIANKLLVTAQ